MKQESKITLSSKDIDEAVKLYLKNNGITSTVEKITYSGDEIGNCVF